MFFKKFGQKAIIVFILATVMISVFSSCAANSMHQHSWKDATCQSPKKCSICNITEGTVVGHAFVDGICSFCQCEDPIFSERKIGSSIYINLISIGAKAEKIGNHIYKAWHFYIYDSDNISLSSDGVVEFAIKTGLSREYVNQAIIEFWAKYGYEESELSNILKQSTLGTLSGCVFVAQRACELSGLTNGVENDLQNIKNQLKSMSPEYEEETGLSILKDLYKNVSTYYDFVNAPSGNINQFSNQVTDYTNKITENASDLEFYYD